MRVCVFCRTRYQKGSGITFHKFITQPLDIVKLRTQLQKGPKRKGVFKTAQRIFVEEGVSAFWHGHILGQAHSILSVCCQFFVYELTTQYVAKYDASTIHSPMVRFICGVFAGACSATLVIPLEVIRVRQMLVKDQYKDTWRGAQAVYRYGGIFAFYEGLGASLIQMGPQVGISFVVFSYAQPRILHALQGCAGEDCAPGSNGNVRQPYDHSSAQANAAQNRYSPLHILIASSVAGSLAGFMAKSLTYPFDLVKRRLQVGSHRPNLKYKTPSTSRHVVQCKSISECLLKTIEKEGIKGLFRGWGVTVYKAQITSVIAFTAYEMLCYSLRELNDKSSGL